MRSRGISIGLAVAAVAVAVVLFIVLKDDEGSDGAATTAQTTQTTTTSDGREPKPEPKPEPEIATVRVVGGEPEGGLAELSFAEGERIQFKVESDVADEIHLHGYDVTQEVEAGGTAKFDVEATIPGVFEVELHHLVVPIAEISVE